MRFTRFMMGSSFLCDFAPCVRLVQSAAFGEAIGASLAAQRVTVSDVHQQVLSSAGLRNLYLTLVRIIIQHLFVKV